MVNPEISIIIPTYNRKASLEKCLESLFVQNYPKDKYEVVVVDDGSEDGTDILVDGLKSRFVNLRYIVQEHGGISKARNNGIKNSSAGLICFIADDYLLPCDYVKTVEDFFKNNPQACVVSFNIVCSKTCGYISRGAYLYWRASFRNFFTVPKNYGKFNFARLLLEKISRIEFNQAQGPYFHLPASRAAAFKKEVFEKAGLFDEVLPIGEDSDMGIRMAEESIGIFCYPLDIVHRAHEDFTGIIKKWFRCGRNLYDFKDKYPKHPMRLADNFYNAIAYLINLVLNPLWRSIQADSFKEAILYFPVIFSINFSYTAGIFYRQLKIATGKDKLISKVRR